MKNLANFKILYKSLNVKLNMNMIIKMNCTYKSPLPMEECLEIDLGDASYASLVSARYKKDSRRWCKPPVVGPIRSAVFTHGVDVDAVDDDIGWSNRWLLDDEPRWPVWW